ncbi:MAG: DNA topoisomerase I, partial [Nitrososphaera sp.]
MWLHDSAGIRQDNDRAKYDKAQKLAEQFDKVRREIIRRTLKGGDKSATVAYLIFRLAMRVGDEKDPDEADTVGASTLRPEHVKFKNEGGREFIEFNFLGKDSVPWQKSLDIDSDETRALAS